MSTLTRYRWPGLLVFALVVALVAVTGGLAASNAGAVYTQLDLPSWAPPQWLFGPVWTVLYAMIAISGWLVWEACGLDRSFVPYVVQLVLNALWTPLFFGAGLYGAAFVDIALLWVAIVVNIVVFLRRRRVAGWLLVPYLLWVTFAAALNLSIWTAN
ncbi:tryptophan-rich sensory protein [Herbidospora galbida]|uniref:Tryptophan-rich sensory protein n=1 Tax=Herbidospora galbida TaxID=2575442 RepID=A0A4U3M254_9ACTN|nr:TspO/MBR family protein [Herbidospora galbida]TKK81277.1 tryptophan-rich sensory protein [Herbidospora galbida]